MNPVLKVIIGAALLIAASLVTLGVLITDLTEKSFYDESGTIKVQGLSAGVTVAKDNFGVSHITAQNEGDMYFSLGYMHAQDRLWQMDLSRRVAQGRLAEILGPEVIEYDKMFKTIGIDKMASVLNERISPKSKELLEKYSAGVNSFIQNNSKTLPLEFDVLNYKPEEWKPEHSLMITRLMGWELNIAWLTDYNFGEIVNKFGMDRSTDFFPEAEKGPFIIRQDSTVKKETPNDSVKSEKKQEKKPEKKVSHNLEYGYKNFSELGKDFYNTAKEFRKFYGTEGSHVGSNSWVVNGSKSESGKPILANDPHLSLQVPSKWYEVDMYNDNTKESICGFSIPGAPAIVIGNNTTISWGITNLMNDDTDFYIFDVDRSQNKYKFNDSLYQLDSTIENIKVKGEKDDISYTVYRTKLGPVISGLEKTGFRTKQKYPKDPNRILTFKWTGYEVSDEISAFYKINNSRNWEEFRTALKDMGAPGSNFIYADTMGNIGYQAAGKVPIRENSATIINENSPMYPSRGEIKWTGFIPFDELPKVYNPKDGYIVTANNKPLKDYKYYITNLYEPEYRAERIESFLKNRGSFNADEFKLIQNDINSLQAKEFCGYMLQSFKEPSTIKNDYDKYLKLIREWDYNMIASSPAATLYAQFELELYKNLYKDALGDEMFNNYIYFKAIPVRNTSKLLKDNKSWLLKGTGESPRDNILRKSFNDAVETLTARSGPDYNNWLWGEVHKVLLRHPLGSVAALSAILNIGPFDIGGCGTTISNSEYSFTDAIANGNFTAILGPSMRMIIDMGSPRTMYTINSTGQSGQPIHHNFGDQSRLWLNGEYKTVTTDLKKLAEEKLNVLILEPQ